MSNRKSKNPHRFHFHFQYSGPVCNNGISSELCQLGYSIDFRWKHISNSRQKKNQVYSVSYLTNKQQQRSDDLIRFWVHATAQRVCLEAINMCMWLCARL